MAPSIWHTDKAASMTVSAKTARDMICPYTGSGCDADKCMMWRWYDMEMHTQPGKTIIDPSLQPMPGGSRDKPFSTEEVIDRRGYCGLVGQAYVL